MNYLIGNFKSKFKKETTNSKNINSLDGIRALALLLVFASHTNAFNLVGQGHIGVWLFFVLSGFLLALPFANNPEKANSFIGMLEFLLKRIKRILPMYFITLGLYYFLSPGIIKNINDLFNHIIFINANLHLWSTQQEIVFYIFMPVILYSNYILYKITKNKLIIGSLLVLLAIILNKYLTIKVFYLLGNSTKQPFYISIFLVGIALAYIYSFIRSNNFFTNKYVKYFLNIFVISVLIIFLISAKYYKNKLGLFMDIEYLSCEYPLIFAFLNAVLILSVILNNNGFINKIFSARILKAISTVSYSMYLIHYLLLFWLIKYIHNNNILFFTLIILTYSLSCFTYYFIERPFIRMNINFFKKNTNRKTLYIQTVKEDCYINYDNIK